jgi:hypothetical protein
MSRRRVVLPQEGNQVSASLLKVGEEAGHRLEALTAEQFAEEGDDVLIAVEDGDDRGSGHARSIIRPTACEHERAIRLTGLATHLRRT